MKKHELSKYDFEALDAALDFAINEGFQGFHGRLEQLKDLFAKAHTGWLEMEEN